VYQKKATNIHERTPGFDHYETLQFCADLARSSQAAPVNCCQQVMRVQDPKQIYTPN
jgi:hypothetical protein